PDERYRARVGRDGDAREVRRVGRCNMPFEGDALAVAGYAENPRLLGKVSGFDLPFFRLEEDLVAEVAQQLQRRLTLGYRQRPRELLALVTWKPPLALVRLLADHAGDVIPPRWTGPRRGTCFFGLAPRRLPESGP